MSLYEAILKYESRYSEICITEAYRKISILQDAEKTAGNRVKVKQIEIDAAKKRAVLDAAYELGKSNVTEQILNILGQKYDDLDAEFREEFVDEPKGLDKDPRVDAARKENFRTRIEFYQQLIEQEGKHNSYIDAAWAQFGDRDGYRTAINPVLESEKKDWNARSEANPSSAEFNQECLDIIVGIREQSIMELFPE